MIDCIKARLATLDIIRHLYIVFFFSFPIWFTNDCLSIKPYIFFSLGLPTNVVDKAPNKQIWIHIFLSIRVPELRT